MVLKSRGHQARVVRPVPFPLGEHGLHAEPGHADMRHEAVILGGILIRALFLGGRREQEKEEGDNKEKDVDNMIQANNINHFFAAVEDSLRKIFLQYQVHVYTIIDRYVHQIYNVDESADDELIADYVFERDLNFSKRRISLCREIYETENYFRNPKNTPYNIK
jgi:hypothetical protein